MCCFLNTCTANWGSPDHFASDWDQISDANVEVICLFIRTTEAVKDFVWEVSYNWDPSLFEEIDICSLALSN